MSAGFFAGRVPRAGLEVALPTRPFFSRVTREDLPSGTLLSTARPADRFGAAECGASSRVAFAARPAGALFAGFAASFAAGFAAPLATALRGDRATEVFAG